MPSSLLCSPPNGNLTLLLLALINPCIIFCEKGMAQKAETGRGSLKMTNPQPSKDSKDSLRQKMEKSALDDEHSFIGKLARQIELEKNKFVPTVKNAPSNSEADIEVEKAKTELRGFLQICEGLRIVGRFYVTEVIQVPDPETPDKQYMIRCRIDEPEIDWEERGKKTRNCTRRVEHSYFYADETLAKQLDRNDVITVQGQVKVIDAEKDGDDTLPYLMVVSANFDILTGRLAEAGAKNHRIAQLLIDDYQISLETDEEKQLKIKAKQQANKFKKQFIANAFAEWVQKLFKDRNDKLTNASTSAQRDDIIKSTDRAFQKYLSTCNSLTFSVRLVIKDVEKNIKNEYVAQCVIAPDQPDDDISFEETEILTIRELKFPVLIKDSIGRVAKPKDYLTAIGTIEIRSSSADGGIDRPINAGSLGNKTRLPLFGAGRNHVFLNLKDAVYESAEE